LPAGAPLERHHLSGCLSAFLSTKKIEGITDMFARDYKIEVAADNKDSVFWKMIRKGEHVSPTDEDKEMAVDMLRKVLTMMETSLKDYRQRKRDEQLPTMEILRELQVTTEHFNEFQQMMKDGELERMTFNSHEHPTIRL
jgi:hypothetical protein